jgi:hypothetical protein
MAVCRAYKNKTQGSSEEVNRTLFKDTINVILKIV